jgi:hypothetical protein
VYAVQVCELCPKGALDKWLSAQARPLPTPLAVRLLRGIATGVNHLHLEARCSVRLVAIGAFVS